MLFKMTGDLVESDVVDIFCHQTNCFGVMRSGIAGQIAQKYDIVRQKDIEYCKNKTRDILGTNLYVRLPDGRVCVNMYAQYKFGRDRCYTEYDKLQQCLNELAERMSSLDSDYKIGFPYKMSCGLAGGNWTIVENMLDQFSENVVQNVFIVELEHKERNIFNVTACFTGSSINIQNKWHEITIQVLPKTYLVRCGNAIKYYSSPESLWNDWICYQQPNLPKLILSGR